MLVSAVITVSHRVLWKYVPVLVLRGVYWKKQHQADELQRVEVDVSQVKKREPIEQLGEKAQKQEKPQVVQLGLQSRRSRRCGRWRCPMGLASVRGQTPSAVSCPKDKGHLLQDLSRDVIKSVFDM